MRQINRKLLHRLYFITIWLLIWELISLLLANRLIFAGPWDTLKALWAILLDYQNTLAIILNSFTKIIMGCLIGMICALAFSMISSGNLLFREFLEPFVHLLKSVPVASFIILALVWVGSRGLAVLIAALITFPILYSQMLSAIIHVPKPMMEMASIYRINGLTKWRYIILPQIEEPVKAAMALAYGMSFKAGVAAELVGVPARSLGEQLYYAKIYLETGDLFAWTILILAVSYFSMKLLGWIILKLFYLWIRKK